MSEVHTERDDAVAELADYPDGAWYVETIYNLGNGHAGVCGLQPEVDEILLSRREEAEHERQEKENIR